MEADEKSTCRECVVLCIYYFEHKRKNSHLSSSRQAGLTSGPRLGPFSFSLPFSIHHRPGSLIRLCNPRFLSLLTFLGIDLAFYKLRFLETTTNVPGLTLIPFFSSPLSLSPLSGLAFSPALVDILIIKNCGQGTRKKDLPLRPRLRHSCELEFIYFNSFPTQWTRLQTRISD